MQMAKSIVRFAAGVNPKSQGQSPARRPSDSAPGLARAAHSELEVQIDRLQRTEQAIVVSTDAPRERGCPPWVVLGAKVIEAPGVQCCVMSR
jgi:hypothetical protein